MSSNNFLIEVSSPYSVDKTVELLIEEATRREWGNPANHNLQANLAKSGKEVKPVQVVEICKPEYSGQMLEKSDERIMSVMMPCRISVYEKADGKTYVAVLNGSSMAVGMPQSIAAPMIAASDETIEIVKAVTGN